MFSAANKLLNKHAERQSSTLFLLGIRISLLLLYTVRRVFPEFWYAPLVPLIPSVVFQVVVVRLLLVLFVAAPLFAVAHKRLGSQTIAVAQMIAAVSILSPEAQSEARSKPFGKLW